MKICENSVIREMTAEEIAEVEEAQARYEAEEKHRPYTIGEVSEMLIRQQINTLSVDDAVAIRMKDFYPVWESGKAYTAAKGCPVGYKVVRNGRLWKLRQEHTSQDNWAPGEAGTESLWEEICEQHDGTKYDPIPYNGNMALQNGLYYTQSGVLYRCTRDTGNPVYHTLSELVGIYVEVAA
jgi:hypothetical protein